MSVSGASNQAHIEIRSHSSYLGMSTTEEVDRVLAGKTRYTYILWVGNENQMHLSYVDEVDKAQKIVHSVFDRNNNGWFYQNYDLHRTSSLEQLIPKIMHCNADLCIPLMIRPIEMHRVT